MSRQPQRNPNRLFSSAVKNTVLPSFRNPHLRRRTPSQDSNLSDAASSSTISTATTPMPQITQDMSEQEAKELRALRFARNVDPEFEKMKEERQKRINYLTENPIQYGKDNPLIGKCLKKCPDYQIRERIVNNQVDMLEKDPSSGQPDPDRFVSKFSRSDAGTNKILEDEVRPPHILKQTVDYLFNDLLRTHGFWNCHHFIRDRCRAIRIEFTYQADIEKELNVQCQERIARFHIYSIHQLRGLPPDERGSLKLEAEQLQKILMTLIELYDELQSRDIISPNEAEFRAYYLIFFPTTTTKRRFLRTLSPQILHHPTLVHAMKLVEPLTTPPSINNLRPVAAQNFGTKFIRLMKSPETPYLMSCLCEIHLDTVRMGMLKALTYTTKNSKAGGMARLIWLQGLLELPTLDDTVEFIKKFRIPYYESDPNVVYFGKTFQGTKIWRNSPTSLLQTELISPNCPELEDKLPQDVSMSDVLNGKVGVHYTSTTASTSVSLTFAEKYGKNPVLGDKVIAGIDSSRMASPNVEKTDNRTTASTEKVHDVAPIKSGEQPTMPSSFTPRITDIKPQRKTDIKPRTDNSKSAVSSPVPTSSKIAAFPATANASSGSLDKTIPSTFGVLANVSSTSISPAQATIPVPITAALAEKTVDHSKATESSSQVAASATSLSFISTTQISSQTSQPFTAVSSTATPASIPTSAFSFGTFPKTEIVSPKSLAFPISSKKQETGSLNQFVHPVVSTTATSVSSSASQNLSVPASPRQSNKRSSSEIESSEQTSSPTQSENPIRKRRKSLTRSVANETMSAILIETLRPLVHSITVDLYRDANKHYQQKVSVLNPVFNETVAELARDLVYKEIAQTFNRERLIRTHLDHWKSKIEKRNKKNRIRERMKSLPVAIPSPSPLKVARKSGDGARMLVLGGSAGATPRRNRFFKEKLGSISVVSSLQSRIGVNKKSKRLFHQTPDTKVPVDKKVGDMKMGQAAKDIVKFKNVVMNFTDVAVSENYRILTQNIQQIPNYAISVSTLPEILNSTNTIIRLWNELVSVYIQSLQYFSDFTKFDIGNHIKLINEIRLNKFSIPPEYSGLVGNSNNDDGMTGMGAAIGMERMEIAGLIQWVWEQYLPFLRLTPEQNMEIRNRIWYCLKVWVERQSSTLPLLNLFQPLFSYLLDRLHSYIQTLPVLKSLPKTTYKQCIQLISVSKEYYKEYCDKLIGDLRDVVVENGDTRRRTGIDGGQVVSKKTRMGDSRPKKAMTVEKKSTATFVEEEEKEEYDWFGRKWEDCEELLRKAGVLS